MKESDLSEPVCNWLKERGYTIYTEMPSGSGVIDIVGKKENDFIIIELKIFLSQQVIRQACRSQSITAKVYCAINTKPRKRGIEDCKKWGIGILRIVNGKIEVILKPRFKHSVIDFYVKRLLERCKTHPKGGCGGLHSRFVRPAQDTAKRVMEYLKKYPEATWKEIFESVPNHYCGHQSMCGALRRFGSIEELKGN